MNSKKTQQDQSLQQLLLDLGPLAIFFITYKSTDLITATAVLIITVLASLAYTYVKTKTIAAMPLITGIMVTMFGGLTIWLNDEHFIKIKPTIVNLMFATILLTGLLFGKSLLKLILGSALELEDRGWRQLSLRWGLFFVFLAVLNEVIWRYFSTDFWVNFKVFGMFGLTLLFTISQIPLIKHHLIDNQEEN